MISTPLQIAKWSGMKVRDLSTLQSSPDFYYLTRSRCHILEILSMDLFTSILTLYHCKIVEHSTRIVKYMYIVQTVDGRI